MFKLKKILKVFALSSFVFTLSHMEAPVVLADVAESPEAHISRGGRLYNDWMVEIDDRPPSKANPNYTGKVETESDIAKSWKCVTCHGWDYKGVDGVKGILGMRGADPQKISIILKDEKHAFQRYLDQEDMDDLSQYISNGLVDMDEIIERKTGKAKADGIPQRPFFETVCAMCHGADGQSIPGISLGQFANQQPYLTLHSIFNGHPGAVMPSLRAFEDDILVELLAYMQLLPENASLVSIVRGGRLYDNWFMETGREVPEGVHVAFPRNLKQEVRDRDTWLCKECHGWDYKGKDGQYAKGKHFTGIKGIEGKKGANVKEIIRILKNDNHEYGAILSDQDLLDLANFVREGQIDMNKYIDDKMHAKGDASRHAEFYPTLCGNCHGAQGRSIRTMPALGRIANDDPWKSLHKLLNGHPADEMPAWRSLNEEAIQDLLMYIQTLPVNKR